jgi:catechol 2,3-dioxygenase-like lactoylglutathione lyase family enzyme
MTGRSEVRQLRVVVHADDYDAALAFYRDALGLPERAHHVTGDAQVTILDAGVATFEIANTAQVRHIDDVEVGYPVSPHIRIAFEVDDVESHTRACVEAGANLIAEPTRTPWNSSNSRMSAPAGLQLTLFQELGSGG